MFELTKAKLEAKKARREAIVAMDKYINTLSASLTGDIPSEQKKEIEDEIMKLVSIKEVYKKNTELPKWASECITTALKIAAIAASVGACEIITNHGSGDKIITDAIKKLPGI